MEYRFERLTAQHFDDLLKIFKKVYPKKRITREYFEKKYSCSHLIEGYFGYLAYSTQGVPVAFFGAIPVLVQFDNRTELAAQACDAMSLPAHSGRGLFTRLGELTTDLLEKNNFKFVFAFLNDNSFPPTIKKLNWTCIGNIKGFRINVVTLPMEKIFSQCRLSEKLYQKIISRYLKSYCSSAERLFTDRNSGFPVVLKDRSFFSYKAFSDNHHITIKNCYLWVKTNGGILIGDMRVNELDDFQEALKLLKRMAFFLGFDEIIFQCSSGMEMEKLWSAESEKFKSWPIAVKNINSKFPLENLKWFYGDIDSF